MSEWQDKAAGTAKEAAGKVTGDDSMESKGKAQQTKGNVEGAANNVKNAVGNAVDDATSDNKT